MPIGRPVATIVLSLAEKEKLTLIANRPQSNQRDALRARIILQASRALSNTEISPRERVSLPTVRKWRSRYARQKIEALATRPSAELREASTQEVEEVLTKTLQTTPLGSNPLRASRLIAKKPAFKHSVLRILARFCSTPSGDSFKSVPPMFVEKCAIRGLYLIRP